MKKVLIICAIILIGLNFTSCTKLPILETSEVTATGGEEDNGNEDPDDD
jgi:hypothetical protein